MAGSLSKYGGLASDCRSLATHPSFPNKSLCHCVFGDVQAQHVSIQFPPSTELHTGSQAVICINIDK